MPYFVYRIVAVGSIRKLTNMGSFAAYQEAAAQCRRLRQSDDARDARFRMIFGDNELHAEELLSEVRAPEPNIGDDY